MSTPAPNRWVCLFTQPRYEGLACDSLKRAGLEPYLPLYRTFVSHARKRSAEVRPLFTRYIFARSNGAPHALRTAYRLQGISGYAGNSFANSLVREDVINLLRSREGDEGLVAMDFNTLIPGQKVKLLSGAFAGFEAVFQEVDDQRRCWIFLEFLGKPHRKNVAMNSLEVVT